MKWRRIILDAIFSGGEMTVRLILVTLALTALCVLLQGALGRDIE